MNPTIIIKSEVQEVSGPPRELLCSVWPVSQEGDDFAIGEPIFSNHMVLVGAAASEERGSILTLPSAGAYLVDVGYSNGQSLRTTISVVENQPYLLVVSPPKQIPILPERAERAELGYGWIPRVISAAPRRKSTKRMDLEVSLIKQPDQSSLSNLFEFINKLSSPNSNRVNIFEQSVSTELIHEVLLAPRLQGPLYTADEMTRRNWLMVSSKGKAQTLLAYPYGWNCRNSHPFKLMMGRKSTETRDANKWATSLKLMDSVYGSMVEHLTRRDLFSTRLISESERGKATTALYKKAGNPYSAAAAAYIFALTGSDEPKHHSWMFNLSHRYTWLPDGAIALGWKTLYDGQDDADAWKTARDLFLLACSRGLPYYTVGLHILVDALTLLSKVNPEDQEILEVLAATKAADVACVRTEPFTTLQIPRYLGLPMKRT